MMILLCCNNPDNGMDTGYFESACLELDDGESVELDCPRMRCEDGCGTLKIGRRRFRYLSAHTWIGNWCWDGWRVTPEVGQAILEYLRQRGAHCTAGPTEIYEAFNEREDAKR